MGNNVDHPEHYQGKHEWEQVRRASVDENGIIASRVLIWDKGTKFDEILSWFDKRHSLGALYLPFGEENSYDEDELQLMDDENVDVLSFVLKFAYETDFHIKAINSAYGALLQDSAYFTISPLTPRITLF